jgi:general stress protein 26
MEALTMDREIIEKASEIISAKRLDCVLALVDSDGYPTASTITVSKADGIKWITFVVNRNSNKPERINRDNRASVCFASLGDIEPLYNITLVGKIEIITVPKIKEEMWWDDCKAHFSGPDDPDYCVLRFTTERYNLFVEWQHLAGSI